MKKGIHEKDKQQRNIPPFLSQKIKEIEEIVLNEIIDSIESGKAPSGHLNRDNEKIWRGI